MTVGQCLKMFKDKFKVLFPRFPMKTTLKQHHDSWGMAIFKWAIPGVLMVSLTFVCMWLLHVGTYLYINQMVRFDEMFERRSDYKPSHRVVPFSIGLNPEGLSYGSLNDPLELSLGFREVSLATLDAIAACFPLAFMVLAVLMDDLGVWTKVLVCNALLALGKGVFGVLTIVPDSKGWEFCQERIGAEGIEWMKDPARWGGGPSHMLWEMFKLELFGANGKRLRWCADMMWSGHTYFTTLYALGVFELTRNLFREDGKDGKQPVKRYAALSIVTLITVGEQVIEIYFVIMNRFHYTMDVAMAILVTFLFYTNGVLCVAVKTWTRLKATPEPEEEEFVIMKVKVVDLHADADVFVPPCCVPCCHIPLVDTSKHLVFGEDDIERLITKNVDDRRKELEQPPAVTMNFNFKANSEKLIDFRKCVRHQNQILPQLQNMNTAVAEGAAGALRDAAEGVKERVRKAR